MKIHPAAWSLFLLLAVGLVGLGTFALRTGTTTAPPFSVPTTEGQTFDLEAHRGRVVVVDFFATYCADCQIIEQRLKAVQARWGADNVTILSLGVAPHETMEELRAYAAEHEIPWTVARDEDHVGDRYGVFELGRVVIVDPTGDVVYAKAGSFQITQASIEEAVDDALAETRAPVRLAEYSVWGLAAVAAVASFFSPCAIGLLPGYVAHTVRSQTAGGKASMTGAARMGLLAALGLLLVFLGIGGLTLLLGRTLTRFVPWFGPLIGLVLLVVGVLLLVRPYSLRLQQVFSPLTQLTTGAGEPARGGLNYFLYGMGYGAGASGCTAPILLSLVATAAAFGPATALGALGLYAVTAAALMVVVTLVLAGTGQGTAHWLQQRSRFVETLSALLFLGGGLFLLWYAWRAGTLPF